MYFYIIESTYNVAYCILIEIYNIIFLILLFHSLFHCFNISFLLRNQHSMLLQFAL